MTSDEAGRRTEALRRLHLLEDVPPAAAARIARIAAQLAGDGFAAGLHLLDDTWQHRVAGVGAPLVREDVHDSFCIAVVRDEQPLYTLDAALEPRVAHSTQARGDARVRTYWGAPLSPLGSSVVGTLCVWSFDERPLDESQRSALGDLAAVAADHLALVALTRELGHDAAHDPLTGVANRTLLSHRISTALARADRGRPEPVLLLIDLDGFKSVNDRYGHAVGDEVLVSAARRLSAVVRAHDLVARLGGDEFAVLLDEPDGGADEVVQRLREAEEAPHRTSQGEVVCRWTIGVAAARADDRPYELLGRADADMYARKRR